MSLPDIKMDEKAPVPRLRSETDSNELEIGEVVRIHEKKFSVWSLLGMGYSISNTAMTLTVSLSAGFADGGPIIFVWGQLLIAAISLGVAVSLGELASAFPHAGGQYYWASELAQPRYKRVISYLVGLLSWGGAVLTAASGTLAIPQMVIGMIMLRNPSFVFHPWMLFVGYQVTNIFIFMFNLVERFLPALNIFSMYFSVTTLIIIFVTVLAASPTKQSAEFVFVKDVNLSGWESDGVAFLVGLVSANWGFSCLDAVTHMAEEVPDPRRNIPKALLATVITGIGTSWPYAIGLMFATQELVAIIETPTGVPSLELFHLAIGNTAGAIGLQSLLVIVFIGAVYSIHTWQSRMAWAFARDNGWPFSRHIAKVLPQPFDVPIYAHIWSCLWVAILGFLYLGSTVAFNSFISGGILVQYISYSICIILLLLHGRNKIEHGPFWLPKLGLLSNVVVLMWTALTLVFYCFPPAYPTTAKTMNYVSCVIVVMFLYAGFYWIIGGRKNYTLPKKME